MNKDSGPHAEAAIGTGLEESSGHKCTGGVRAEEVTFDQVPSSRLEHNPGLDPVDDQAANGAITGMDA